MNLKNDFDKPNGLYNYPIYIRDLDEKRLHLENRSLF